MVENTMKERRSFEEDEEKLEEALEDSFPASDPPAITTPHTHVGEPDKNKKQNEKD